MTLTSITSQLHGLRMTGPARWMAKCPSHPDKNPSLSIRQLENGTILIHCFAGCPVESVTSALGIRVSDLFEKATPKLYKKRLTRGFNALDVLHAIADEVVVVLIAAKQIEQGQTLSCEDKSRLKEAIGRINMALGVIDAEY